MAKAAKKKPSMDSLIGRALDQGLAETKEIMAAVKKARPEAADTSIQSRISAVKKERGLGRSRSTPALTKSIETEAAMLFILKQGSIEKAKAVLGRVKEDPVLAFVIAAGGIKAAQAAVQAVESKLDHVPF